MKKDDSKRIFSNGYKFNDGTRVTAILDQNGSLTLKGDADDPKSTSLTVFDTWKNYVREVMQDVPVKSGAEDEVVEQLSMILGDATTVEVEVSGHEGRKKKPTEEGETDMATKTAVKKAATPAKKPTAAAKRAKEVKDPKDCTCGCGAQTKGGNFVAGHDARVHGWGKKIGRGEMKFNEVPAIAQKFLKAHGITQGVLAK